MANFTRNFIAGKMNKTFDERFVPDGEYIDAMNVRMGSTEKSEAGVIENTNGNLPLTALEYNGKPLSSYARCIGAIEDSAKETIYWFVHDSQFQSTTGKLDLVVSFNVVTQLLTYHIISVDDGGGVNTTLNFNEQYLITGINLIEDLLYWTDDYNPPRFINVKTGYANPNGAGIDYNGQPDLLYETIQVIKKPPTSAPTLSLLNTVGEENYLQDRFICFAYRYQYANGQYSATSQWTEPAFLPSPFSFSKDSFLNEGMVNDYNGVNVNYNSGSSLVIGIDILFKEATGNVIKVIEKLNKSIIGLSNNTTYSYFFNNSKIYTILPESELLRLYDNVPRLAKAQTIMGNRLMYGNYVDGYDLVDKNGYPVLLEYTTSLITEEINTILVPTTLDSTTYTIDGSQTIANSSLIIDFTGINLIQGSLITFSVSVFHDSFSGTPPFPTQTTGTTQINFSIYLQNTYSSVYAFATSTEFIDAIGTSLPGGNIQLVYNPSGNDSCDGLTFTDSYNCSLPYFLGTLVKINTGTSFLGQAIQIISTPSSNDIKLVFLAAKYVDNPTTPTQNVYEYYKILNHSVQYFGIGVPKSLHSNRGYEIGIVYMDEYLRSTPANVSQFNNVFVPCSYSKNKNSITVTIPPSQVAPYWATRYKFVCKSDQHRYETIYSSVYFEDPGTGDVYFLLEGENARKIEEGDRLIVKADSSGPKDSCVYVTVLTKESKSSGFITPANNVVPPAGVYMKITSDELLVNTSASSNINRFSHRYASSGNPNLNILMNIPGTDPLFPSWQYVDYIVPAGSVIKFKIKNQVKGDLVCLDKLYTFEGEFISKNDYNNIYLWFIGDGIAAEIIGNAVNNYGVTFLPGIGPIPSPPFPGYDPTYDIVYKFDRDLVTNKLTLNFIGFSACNTWFPSNRTQSSISVEFDFTSDSNYIFIFETEPTDTLPDVFFENELSYPIDANGNHLSNGLVGDQSQNIALGVPAIIQTGFFNCFSFGNGAESFKIRDSLVGRDFNLGNRVTTVAAQDYKESRRFADITYSGVYNPETNVNKLNEFNYALLNYKNLELSFGAVYILDGRETDVLVLQEDKVSYVLAGKNLLSDAAAGGAITSVPEVLGTQIARTEKYGISFNPESYVQWGYDRFFTDAKRGAVLQLKGNSYSNEQIVVISEQNMRTWFRDEFIETFSTQKLGGFDPYMNEYVLTMNDRKLPQEIDCIKCGITQTFTFAQGAGIKVDYEYCVGLGIAIGDVVVQWDVISIDIDTKFDIIATYDGNSYPSGSQNSSGSLSFFKNNQSPDSVDIYIATNGNVVLSVTVYCPQEEPMTLVQVVWTNNNDAGSIAMKQFNYVNGMFTSPLQTALIPFASGTGNPLVSYYLVTNGFEGQGPIPVAGSTMTLKINENFPWVSFTFNPLVHKFKYARTNVLYGSNDIDMQALLAVSTTATPITTPMSGVYAADFIVPPSANGQYLYIIWDLRQSYGAQLCYGETLEEVCCECVPCEEECSQYVFINPETQETNAEVIFPSGSCYVPEGFTQIIEPGEAFSFCLPNIKDNYIITQGNPVVYMESCFCGG